MTRRKVLFLIHTLGGGGAEKVLVDTVNRLDPKRFDVTVMTVIDTGINRRRLGSHVTYTTMFRLPSIVTPQSGSGSLSANAPLKVKVFGALYNTMWRLLPIRMIYRLFVRQRYDVEVAFLEGIAAKLIARSTNPHSRKLCWIHVDFSNEHKSSRVFLTAGAERRCYEAFDRLVCVSEATQKGFAQTVGLAERTMVLRNVVDFSTIIEQSRELAERPREFTICSVGRLAPQKGYDRLLRVVKRLRDDGLLFQVQIIGDGPERAALEAYCQRHRLDCVALLGFQQNPYRFVAAADLFVISSRAEGFSTVMSEALAIGAPVLSTRVSGTEALPSEMVVENSEEALYEGLAAVIRDPRRYGAVKQASQQVRRDVMDASERALQVLEEDLLR